MTSSMTIAATPAQALNARVQRAARHLLHNPMTLIGSSARALLVCGA